MTTIPNYSKDAWLSSRFAKHVELALTPTLKNRTDYPKNWAEKMGDVGLWTIEELPAKIWNGLKDPRIVTLALTAMALIAVSFAFYPVLTTLYFKMAWAMIPLPPFWAVKFSAYAYSVGLILSAAMRAEGRFCNAELMKVFYKLV